MTVVSNAREALGSPGTQALCRIGVAAGTLFSKIPAGFLSALGLFDILFCDSMICCVICMM